MGFSLNLECPFTSHLAQWKSLPVFKTIWRKPSTLYLQDPSFRSLWRKDSDNSDLRLELLVPGSAEVGTSRLRGPRREYEQRSNADEAPSPSASAMASAPCALGSLPGTLIPTVWDRRDSLCPGRQFPNLFKRVTHFFPESTKIQHINVELLMMKQ